MHLSTQITTHSHLQLVGADDFAGWLRHGLLSSTDMMDTNPWFTHTCIVSTFCNVNSSGLHFVYLHRSFTFFIYEEITV